MKLAEQLIRRHQVCQERPELSRNRSSLAKTNRFLNLITLQVQSSTDANTSGNCSSYREMGCEDTAEYLFWRHEVSTALEWFAFQPGAFENFTGSFTHSVFIRATK